MPITNEQPTVPEGQVVEVPRAFTPLGARAGEMTAVPAGGYAVTRFRRDPAEIGAARALGIHVARYNDRTPDGRLLISNQDAFERTPEGYLLERGDLIGIEDAEHAKARRDYQAQRAMHQRQMYEPAPQARPATAPGVPVEGMVDIPNAVFTEALRAAQLAAQAEA